MARRSQKPVGGERPGRQQISRPKRLERAGCRAQRKGETQMKAKSMLKTIGLGLGLAAGVAAGAAQAADKYKIYLIDELHRQRLAGRSGQDGQGHGGLERIQGQGRPQGPGRRTQRAEADPADQRDGRGRRQGDHRLSDLADRAQRGRQGRLRQGRDHRRLRRRSSRSRAPTTPMSINTSGARSRPSGSPRSSTARATSS